MNIGKDVMLLLGGAVALIVLLTVVTGGSLGLGTSPQGPYLQFGYKGPKAA
jgi:hypothetical protein